jgi:hypothetical protein
MKDGEHVTGVSIGTRKTELNLFAAIGIISASTGTAGTGWSPHVKAVLGGRSGSVASGLLPALLHGTR